MVVYRKWFVKVFGLKFLFYYYDFKNPFFYSFKTIKLTQFRAIKYLSPLKLVNFILSTMANNKTNMLY